METKIRKLSSANYPEIMKIWEASVRATHHFLTASDIDFYRPYILKYALPDCDLYGISKSSGQNSSEPSKPLLGFMATKGSKIEMLFLSPDCRGQGLGKTFLDYALNYLHIYQVDVNEENASALGFYLHLGCQIISRDEIDGNGKPHPILHLEYPHG